MRALVSDSPVLARPGFLTHVLPAVLYVVAVFSAGSVSFGPKLPTGILPADKVFHALAFGGMQFVFFRAMGWWRSLRPRTEVLLLSAGAATLVGALLELYQAALPHRSAELSDWLADIVGIGVVLVGQTFARRT